MEYTRTPKTTIDGLTRLLGILEKIDKEIRSLKLKNDTSCLRTIVREQISIYKNQRNFSALNHLRLKSDAQQKMNELNQKYRQERAVFQEQFQFSNEEGPNSDSAYQKYDVVPWYRKSGINGNFTLVGFIYPPLPMVGLCSMSYRKCLLQKK